MAKSKVTTHEETVAIDSLSRYEKNPRQHPERQIGELVRSLKEFGQYRPLVVDEAGVILAGNGLHEALSRAGYTEIRIHRITGLTEEQKVKLVLADNRTSDLSSDDYDVIEELLGSLTDYDIPGYDPEMVRELIASSEELTADAIEFGTLPQETIDKLNSRSEGVDEENAEALVGEAPAPIHDPMRGVIEPTGPVAPEADEAKDSGEPCPTCGRAW